MERPSKDISQPKVSLNQLQPPAISPVPHGIHRPFLSVMIPTYNCARFLKEALRSVLEQAPEPELMQIEVVDDYSNDNPKSVIDELGVEKRVGFYQQSRNVGATENFNTCIKLAKGYWIHILHGDDLVEHDFYENITRLAHQYPQAGLLVSRALEIDEKGELLRLSDRFQSLETYSCDPSPFFYNNVFRTPSVVVSRSFYEIYGGFHPALIHTADWELWIRAIATKGGIGINQPLARYRIFSSSHTGRLQRTGENLHDYLRLASLSFSEYPNFCMDKFKKLVSEQARRQIELFVKLGDKGAIQANYRIWWRNSRLTNKIYWLTKDFLTLGRNINEI
jgi:glycosyltransferase involved in cell wall biosynthesis